ncbi:hypothetical protein ACS86_00625 [Vibrio alginolyticus]|nr:hypothetical protein ACS86_00625 [Vibrio alginolyticus]
MVVNAVFCPVSERGGSATRVKVPHEVANWNALRASKKRTRSGKESIKDGLPTGQLNRRK